MLHSGKKHKINILISLRAFWVFFSLCFITNNWLILFPLFFLVWLLWHNNNNNNKNNNNNQKMIYSPSKNMQSKAGPGK